jgi:predicted transcriptional regulator
MTKPEKPDSASRAMNSFNNPETESKLVHNMPYSFKQILEKLSREKAAGPSPTFSVFHLIVTLELIANKPIGRNRLAKELNVGDGAIRTIIERLKNAGLIITSKTGCFLTEEGRKLWKEYSMTMKKAEIENNELALANHSFAIAVRNRGNRIESGMEQRDAAIIMGAKSVTTMRLSKGCLIIPSVSNDVAHDFPVAAEEIMKLLAPHENDAVIISSADDPRKAEYGALSAAWTLID